MQENYENMYHNDYAKHVLDSDGYDTYSQFITDIFDNKEGILCLFVGFGANGKSTLCSKIDEYWPKLFSSHKSDNPRCMIINDYETTHEVIESLKKYGNVILTLADIESIENIAELEDMFDIRPIYFTKTFP
jgi:hypothetical protein